MINEVTSNQKYFLNDVPKEVIKYVIIQYTGYNPNVSIVSKKFYKFYNDYLMKDLLESFRDFYTNRTITYLLEISETNSTTMKCLEDNSGCSKLKKPLKDAEKAKEERNFEEEFKNLAKIYQLLSQALKKYHPSEYNRINKKFGKNSVSGAKASEVLEAILKCDHFRISWQGGKWRLSDNLKFNPMTLLSNLPPKTATVNKINNWFNNNSKYISVLFCELYLNNLNLIIIPSQLLNHLKSLERLLLSYNQLSDISELSKLDLKSLKNLNLSHNKITEISLSLKKLPSLGILNLSYNKITKISLSLEKLPSLGMLIICNNKIKDIFLSEAENLQILYLNYNMIENISGLKNLKNLKILKICNNKIVDIPVLRYLKKLKKVYLDNNPIKKISCFENSESLKKLSIKNTNVPEKEINNLKYLYLPNCMIIKPNGDVLE